MARKTIKVGRAYQARQGGKFKAVPFIRLSGQWLAEAGFQIGGRIEVSVSPQGIQLVPVSPPVGGALYHTDNSNLKVQ